MLDHRLSLVRLELVRVLLLELLGLLVLRLSVLLASSIETAPGFDALGLLVLIFAFSSSSP